MNGDYKRVNRRKIWLTHSASKNAVFKVRFSLLKEMITSSRSGAHRELYQVLGKTTPLGPDFKV